jgi:hypothetical protein
VVFENQPERLPDAGIVVDDEDDGARHAGTLASIPALPVASREVLRVARSVSNARH